jgi:hypothetical protein
LAGRLAGHGGVDLGSGEDCLDNGPGRDRLRGGVYTKNRRS